MPKSPIAKATAVRKKRGQYKSREASGIVRDDESFTVAGLAERLGATPNLIYDYEKDGLPIHKRGNRCRILGREFNEWWASHPTTREEKDSASVA